MRVGSKNPYSTENIKLSIIFNKSLDEFLK